MSLRRSSLLRSLSSTALLGLALAFTTGCEPVMEAYMAKEVGIRSQQFGTTDPIHCVAYLRGGDTDTRLTFTLVQRPDGSPGLAESYYPRPTTAELGGPLEFDLEMGITLSDGSHSTEGPWVPGKYRMRVALEDAGSDTLIQDEELSFSIQ